MKKLAINIFDLHWGFLYTHFGFCISGVTYYWLLRLLLADQNGQFPGHWSLWLMFAPLIYVTWLGVFLIQCIVESHIHRVWLMYRKCPRVSPRDGLHSYLLFYASILLYLRMRFVYSLPLVNALITLPAVRHLVFRSYALSDHLGNHSLVLGLLYDPDITFIGDDAIVGSGASVIAHSLTTNPDGSRLLVTVPVHIGPRAVIGGGATIHPGVVIGADAVIEPSSYVPAMTQIGDGEVWGGTPARFLRMRDSDAAVRTSAAAGQSPPLTSEEEQKLRQIVAEVLHRPLDSISDDFGMKDTAAWDSLAQLSIALRLQQTFQVRLSSTESFRLRSLSDLRTVLHRRSFPV